MYQTCVCWVEGSCHADAGGGEAEVRMGDVRRMEREALEARLGRGGYVVGAVRCMRCGGSGVRRWRGGLGMGRLTGPPLGGQDNTTHTHTPTYYQHL